MGKKVLKLSPEEKAALKKTWNIVKTDLQATGELIFHVLLEKHPEFEIHFENLNVADDEFVNEEGRPLSKKVWYRRHAGVDVMRILGRLVEAFEGEDSGLTTLDELLTLGDKHYQMSISPIHIQAFKEAAIETLKRGLKGKLEPEANKAWRKFLEAICSTIQEGMEAAEIRKNKLTNEFDFYDD